MNYYVYKNYHKMAEFDRLCDAYRYARWLANLAEPNLIITVFDSTNGTQVLLCVLSREYTYN